MVTFSNCWHTSIAIGYRHTIFSVAKERICNADAFREKGLLLGHSIVVHQQARPLFANILLLLLRSLFTARVQQVQIPSGIACHSYSAIYTFRTQLVTNEQSC